VYVAVGVLFPDFLLAYPVAIAYLLVTVWLIPTLFRR
jgi:hypothetical protein